MRVLFNVFLLFLSTQINGNDPLLRDGSQILLHVDSLGHALYAFVNGKLAGYLLIIRISLIDIVYSQGLT